MQGAVFGLFGYLLVNAAYGKVVLTMQQLQHQQ